MHVLKPSAQKIIIAGPCALENKSQLVDCVKHINHLKIKIMRASLWKPRTSPGWDGLGFYGLPMLFEETINHGITPATEILSSIHAQMCVDALKQFGERGKLIVWIGSRNQNHFELRRMAHILAEGPENLVLMFKNQVWFDKKHWLGIYQHILQAGFPVERLLACHRGFHPGYNSNPKGLRNIPEYELAMEMKDIMGVPMLLDPSHIAGSREKVFEVVQESLNYNFDGYIIEVHDNISQAKTDTSQQLTFEQLEKLLKIIHKEECHMQQVAYH